MGRADGRRTKQREVRGAPENADRRGSGWGGGNTGIRRGTYFLNGIVEEKSGIPLEPRFNGVTVVVFEDNVGAWTRGGEGKVWSRYKGENRSGPNL